MDATIDGVRVELVRGGITRQDDVGAVVNAANAELHADVLDDLGPGASR